MKLFNVASDFVSDPTKQLGLPNVTVDSGVSKIVDVVFMAAGILAVIFIIVGGFQYVLSGGDASGIKKAKETITYAIVGLIVTLLAFGIVHYVVGITG